MLNCPEKFSELEITGVTDDSRKARKDSLFIAVKGPLSDGHDYAKQALEKGAAVIITERDLKEKNQIVVSDTHSVLAEICGNWFGNPQKKLKIILHEKDSYSN